MRRGREMTNTRGTSVKYHRQWVWMIVAIILMVAASSLHDKVLGQEPGARGKKKIYIVTDLEGVTGVYQFAQTRDPGPLNEKAKEFFMGDLAAVIKGLRDGGAEEIWVLDGHGSGAVLPELMVPGAVYIVGTPRPVLYGLDETFAGLVQFAAHAMNGTPDGVLAHTQSSRSENRYWYNGVESGELAQVAAYAGHFDVPTIMVTGDEAACREARQFFGEHVVTVAVKRGISREAAVLYPFEDTRKALYEGAQKAMEVIPLCKPYKLQTPIQARKEWLIFDSPDGKPRLMTKEGTIDSVLRIFEF
jgi:D-amino peptidase